MQLYLPIAEMPVNLLLILSMGFAVGFLSGLFGVGGGFLMPPLLLFMGLPPAVAGVLADAYGVPSTFLWAAGIVLATALVAGVTRWERGVPSSKN